MNRGYVKLWRKMLDGGILEDAISLQVWIWLLLNATHKPRTLTYRGETYHLEPGQVFVSERHLAEVLRASKSSIRRRIIVMKSDHRTDHRTVHRGTIVTICNWDRYQTNIAECGPQDEPQCETKVDRRRTKNKKERKKEEENEANETIPYGSGFAAAWETWIQYRREIKHPLTPSTIRTQLRTLAAFGDEGRAVAMIEHTIFKGWQGLREKEASRTGRGSDSAPQYPRG